MFSAKNIAHLNSRKWLHFNLCLYLCTIFISCFKRLSYEIWGTPNFHVIQELVAFLFIQSCNQSIFFSKIISTIDITKYYIINKHCSNIHKDLLVVKKCKVSKLYKIEFGSFYIVVPSLQILQILNTFTYFYIV